MPDVQCAQFHADCGVGQGDARGSGALQDGILHDFHDGAFVRFEVVDDFERVGLIIGWSFSGCGVYFYDSRRRCWCNTIAGMRKALGRPIIVSGLNFVHEQYVER